MKVWLLAVLTLVSIVCVATAQQRTAVSQVAVSPRADVSQTMSQIQGDLTSLDKSHQAYREAAEKLAGLYSDLGRKAEAVVKASAAATPGNAAALASLQTAIKQLQQTQTSSNLQYLQLQQSMQNENRQYTMVSNVLKTKYDTVKNSISNVR